MSVLNGVGPKGTRMLCEHIEGSLIDGAFTAHLARELGSYEVEDVSFTWDETSKRILRKTGSLGTDVGVRLDEAARARGVKSGDVLGIDWGRHRVFVARVAPTEVIVAHVDAADVVTAARLAWEVGNTHTPLFAGAQMGEFAMPWSEPLMALLHVLFAEALLVCLPFTRLSHAFLIPFTRAYMGSEAIGVRKTCDW